MGRVGRQLTYANVVATLALVAAVAGGSAALAVNTKLKKGSVGTKAIKGGSVTASKLAGIDVVSRSGGLTAVATCPGGERLIGGGGQSEPIPNAPPEPHYLVKSQPEGNGWFAQSNLNVTAYALCLKGRPGG